MSSDERNPERDSADSLEQRVASLEAAVRSLSQELQRLRQAESPLAPPPAVTPPPRPASAPRSEWSMPDAGAGHISPAFQQRPTTPPPFPAHATPSPNWLPANVDLEALVGRYGTLVLATISALAAVGLFLNWAIERGFLGPQQRLGLGLITAAGLAVAGLRLRRRERSFGASLLGLALAVALVCAWGAGPALKLVPNWVAFVFATIVSVALAVFAHAEHDEPLWSVGFSGAAIAPFVTADGRSDLLLLFAYGVAVHACAGYAMNNRRWLVAGRIFLISSAVYTLALATGFERDFGPLYAMAFALAVALAGVLPWTAGWARRERLRAVGALAALAAIRTGISTEIPLENAVIAGMITAGGVLWLVLVDVTCRVSEPLPEIHRYLHEGDWLDAAVLPLAFALSVIAALDAGATTSGLVMAAAASVFLLMVMRAAAGSMRDASAFVTVISALVSLFLLLEGHGNLLISSVAALSLACFAANRAWPSGSWTTLGLIGLAMTAAGAFIELLERPAYEYLPFGTEASAVSSAVLVSIALSSQLTGNDRRLATSLRAGALVWAFLWVHQEIAFAFNETAATLLRVSYYASTSVAGVWVGRARSLPVFRHAGLALAVIAAGTAFYGARGLDAVAARIGAHLVAAVFLLSIAYWYRRVDS